jgi:hypothetical protein
MALSASTAVSCGTASAQSVPDPTQQEILVKSTILTFNDANLTGDYAVLHAKLSKPFRDQFSPDKLKDVFKSFSEQQVDLAGIVVKPIVPTGKAQIDKDGVLVLSGYFDTTPSRVSYQLKFIQSDLEWKAVGIHVDVDPAKK